MKLGLERSMQMLLTSWEKRPVLAWTLSILWLALICFLAFVWQLGSVGLVDETEPLFAEAARQMTVTGDWVTPYFNGNTRFDKPPLIYWLMAIAYQILGVNEWAVRLPSAFAAIALVVLTFLTLRAFGIPSPGLLSHQPADRSESPGTSQRGWAAGIGSSMLALNIHMIAWGRTGVSDMLLNGCMGTALLAFFWGYAQPERPKVQGRWYLAFYALSALAVLTKGPVGIVLPGFIIGAFLWLTGNLRQSLRELRILPGSLLFLAIAVPWYVLVIQANGDAYIESFFGYHNFERFTEVVNDHAAPWYFYFPAVWVGFFPWSVYLPVAIARLRFWRIRPWRQQPRSTHLGLFALTWFAVIFGFFTLAATKLPSYVLPLMPAAAILVGLFWSDSLTRQTLEHPWLKRMITVSHSIGIGLLLVLAGVVFYSPHWMDHDTAMPTLPQVAQQLVALPLGVAVWTIAAIAALTLLLRRQGEWIWSVQAIGWMAFLLFTVMPFMTTVDSLRQLPLRQLSATAIQVQQEHEPIAMVGFMKPSVVFYTQRPVIFWINHKTVIRQIRQETRPMRPRPDSILLMGQTRKLERTGIPPADYDVIQQAGAYELIRVPLPLPADLQVNTGE